MTDELVKRYDVYPAYHGVDVEECPVGEFVYYADHADRIEQLVATNKQLTAERDEAWEAGNDAAKALRVIAGMDLMGASATAWNAARELAAALKGGTP